MYIVIRRINYWLERQTDYFKAASGNEDEKIYYTVKKTIEEFMGRREEKRWWKKMETLVYDENLVCMYVSV
jgi:hypothetical protein